MLNSIYEALKNAGLVKGQTNKYWCTTQKHTYGMNYRITFSCRLYVKLNELTRYKTRDTVDLTGLNGFLASSRTKTQITNKIHSFWRMRTTLTTIYAQLVPKPLKATFTLKLPDLPPIRLSRSSISILALLL
ncbi:hypothetical protein SNEBB_000398 [Seison nebaliae]|nr:hypothetical protein SNEBB_000398 [Seison nebaliae]